MFSRPDRRLLYEIFEPEPGGASFGLTESGIWHPTPLDVLLPALQAIVEAGWLGSGSQPLTILDAGSGDGRVVAALALLQGLGAQTRILGLETDSALDRRARGALDRLAPKRYARTAVGNFLAVASYQASGIRPPDVDVFLNYPDGNEQALASFVGRQAPRSQLVVLSPDRSGLQLEGLELLATLEVATEGDGLQWEARRFGAR